MPTNKHAIIRYRTIDRCLRDRNGRWDWRTLAAECAREIGIATGVDIKLSERTIKGDLADMRNNDILGYYAPIDYDRKEKSYYYTDPRYAISEVAINKEDKSQLNQALEILKQFGGLSDVMGVQSIITKLQHTIDNRVDRAESIIHFDHPLDAPGQEWLYHLYNHIREKQAVSIMYHPFGRKRSNHLMSPYILKEFQKRWYLIGYHHDKEQIRTLALDRIQEVKESLTAYIHDEGFNAATYFSDVIGLTISPGSAPQRILLMATGLQIQYFKTRPMHSSQTLIEEQDDYAIFSLNVIINFELVSELFSYREGVEVLEPQSLRDEMQEVIQNMGKRYS